MQVMEQRRVPHSSQTAQSQWKRMALRQHRPTMLSWSPASSPCPRGAGLLAPQFQLQHRWLAWLLS